MKIAITGPESTGKTILASDLAREFNTIWVPEYSREYLEQRDGFYDFNDIEIIAKGQVKRWENVDKNHKVVFYDTEFTVLKIWSEIKYNKVSPYVINGLANQKFDHYFICDPEGVRWEEDPLREHPERREEFFELYLRVMDSNKRSYTVLSGDWDKRLKKAVSVVKNLI